MKHLKKVLALLALLTVTIFALVACGGGDEPVDTDPSQGGSSGGNTPVVLFDMSTDRIRFNNKSYLYDGELHTHETYTGNTEPTNTTPHFEYWKDGVKVADEGVGVSEPGIYTVKLIFTKQGYNDATVEARLTIEQSWGITYNVGSSTTLPADTSMTVSDSNPTVFSSSTLADEAPLFSATLKDYKFKGWYLNAACTGDAVTAIDGSKYNGPITLYAKFQPYLAYPTPYEYTTTVSGEPTTLPEIPGYDELPDDAFTLINMDNLAPSAETGTSNMGLKYSNVDSNLNSVTNTAQQTAGGEWVFRWIDYNDQYDDGLEGEDHKNTPNDNNFCDSLHFYNPLKGFNPKDYSTIEFWVYSAKSTVTSENPTGDVFTFFTLVDNQNGKPMRCDIALDFSGWKKFSFSLSDLETPAGASMNITRVSLFARPYPGGIGSDNATLYLDTTENYVYFSSIYLTNHITSYDVTKTVSKDYMETVLGNFAQLTGCKTVDDTAVAAIVDSLIASPVDLGPLFDDVAVSSLSGLATSYNRLLTMAEAWNNTGSTYYHSSDLLNSIGAGMNQLAGTTYQLIEDGVAKNADVRTICLDIVNITNIVGDYISTVHGNAWMPVVLHYYPSALGTGEDAMVSAYIFASASLARGDRLGFLNGLRQMTSVFNQRTVTANVNSADVTCAMYMIAALNGTPFAPTRTTFITDMFAWFFEAVDALTVDGVFPTAISADRTLASYVASMLLVYDMAPQAEQTEFTALVKYYMAQDAGFETALTDLFIYDKQATALAAIKASSVTAAAGDDVAVVNESIGQALYRNDNYFFLLTSAGELYTTASSVLLTPTTYTMFKGIAADDLMAIVADDNVIVANANGVTVTDTNAFITGANSTSVYVVTDTTSRFTDPDAFLNEAETACILLVTENADGTVTCTVYNYTDSTETINININGYYMMHSIEDLITSRTSDVSTVTTITIAADQTNARVYTFTLEALT